jgi:hypothetical protein
MITMKNPEEKFLTWSTRSTVLAASAAYFRAKNLFNGTKSFILIISSGKNINFNVQILTKVMGIWHFIRRLENVVV